MRRRPPGGQELTYQPLNLPTSAHKAHSLTICTAQPGTPDEERLKLLADWTAAPSDDIKTLSITSAPRCFPRSRQI